MTKITRSTQRLKLSCWGQLSSVLCASLYIGIYKYKVKQGRQICRSPKPPPSRLCPLLLAKDLEDRGYRSSKLKLKLATTFWPPVVCSPLAFIPEQSRLTDVERASIKDFICIVPQT